MKTYTLTAEGSVMNRTWKRFLFALVFTLVFLDGFSLHAEDLRAAEKNNRTILLVFWPVNCVAFDGKYPDMNPPNAPC
jgi:hypothetical protein